MEKWQLAQQKGRNYKPPRCLPGEAGHKETAGPPIVKGEAWVWNRGAD